MKLAVVAGIVLAAYGIASAAKTRYVVPDSVDCISTGIDFSLSTDPTVSGLAAETQLNVNLYTANQEAVLDFDPATGLVKLPYRQYGIIATTIYGSNQRAILYNVDQPFWAVPKPGLGIGRNYTFSVGCVIPAYYDVDVTGNTTDDGHGDHGGGTVDPSKHIDVSLQGLRPDGTVSLGAPLTYTISLKDDIYTGLIPASCIYYDPSNPSDQLQFVSNNCPIQFPNDPDSYFGTIQRLGYGSYQLLFKAFAFDDDVNSILGISCDILVCIDNNTADCYKPCWGPDITTSAGPPTEETTSSETPPDTTTSEAPTDTTTSEIPTDTTTPEEPTDTTTESVAPPRHKRTVLNFKLTRNGALKDPSEKEMAVSTTTKQNTVVKVNMPGTESVCNPQAICNDASLLAALYGVVSALAVLIIILVLTVLYLLCVGRRAKIAQYPMMVPENRVYQ